MVIYASLFKTKFSTFLGHLSTFRETHYTKVEFYQKYYNVLSISDFVISICNLKKKKEIKTKLYTAENSCFAKELLHKFDKRIRPNNEYVHTETIKKCG